MSDALFNWRSFSPLPFLSHSKRRVSLIEGRERKGMRSLLVACWPGMGCAFLRRRGWKRDFAMPSWFCGSERMCGTRLYASCSSLPGCYTRIRYLKFVIGFRVCPRNELSFPVRGAGRLVGRLPRDETEYGDYEGPSFWLRLI